MGVAPASGNPALKGAPPDPLADIRSLFSPAPGLVYLDTATYGLPPRPTVEALRRFIAAWSDGTGDWIADWDQPSDRCRTDFADLIGARPADIAGIPAASVGVGVVTSALQPGDEIVVPEDEFTSTLFPLLVASRRGCRIHEVPFERLADEVSPHTRLVATSLVQMQTGRTADLRAICDAAERVGASVLIDATQGIPFVDVSSLIGRRTFVAASDIRYLASCGHVVGTHSHTHPDIFPDLTPERMVEEWRTSGDAIGQILGESCVTASVPGGDISRQVLESAARAGVQYLFTSEPWLSPRAVDGCCVLGRFSPKVGTSSARIRELAQFRGWTSALLVRRLKGLARAGFPLLYRHYVRRITHAQPGAI